MVPFQACEHPLRPTLGRHIVIYVAIDPRVKAHGAVPLQSQVEFAAALAEAVVSSIAQSKNGKF
jgi:hypothetical protein